jgi:hypothetical protein
MPKHDNSPLEYEERAVLFLDFLGFRETINSTLVDPSRIAEVVWAINRLRSIARQKEFFKSQQVTQFSDCVVVSYRCDEPSAAFDLITEIGFAVIDLVARGFLVRGGVAIGKLIHTDDYIFGPAMNEAYDLESKCAIYPRVLISDRLFDVARSAPAAHHDANDEQAYVAAYLAQDSDGCHYLDYVPWRAVVEVNGIDNDDYAKYLVSIAGILKRGLSVQSPEVRLKYRWLYEKYAAEVRKFRAIGADDHWAKSNAEMHEVICALPLDF